MTQTLDETVGRLRALLPLDFPDSLPIYLVGRYEIPPHLARVGEMSSCLACTSHVMDMQFRRELERNRRWRGRGFAVQICDIQLFYEPDELLRVLLHEAAHYFDCAQPLLLRPVEELPADLQYLDELPAVENEAEEQARLDAKIAADRLARPWRSHEWRFIRAAGHLAHRATLNGRPTSPDDLFFPQFYGLSPMRDQLAALGDEPERCAHLPLREVMATDSPPALIELFEADRARYAARATAGGSP